MTPLAKVMRILGIREMTPAARVRLALLGVLKPLAARGPVERFPIAIPPGRIAIARDSLEADWRTFSEVFVERDYEADYAGAVVVDIGAHKGYAGAFALARGARAVRSYEPEPTNFGYLAAAAAVYRAAGRNWRCEQAAVASTNGDADLYVSASSWAHSVTAPPQDVVRTLRVRRVTLAGVLAEAARLDGRRLIVKIDAEGAEGELLLATGDEVWSVVDELVVEVHPGPPAWPEELAKRVADLGFDRLPAGKGILRAVRSAR